jgi:hypothetical protein
MSSNRAIDSVPFGHWTLRDEAAQRRSSPRPMRFEANWHAGQSKQAA